MKVVLRFLSIWLAFAITYYFFTNNADLTLKAKPFSEWPLWRHKVTVLLALFSAALTNYEIYRTNRR